MQLFRSALVCVTLGITAGGVHAQYPTKPVRIIVPFSAGSTTDVIARILALPMQQGLGQTMVIDNRPGGDGALAGDMVARAPADGYTLLVATNSPLSAVPHLRKKPPYDALKDFAPVSMVGYYTFLLAVNPAVPARTLDQLVAHVKANPGKMSYASSGPGSPQHLGMEFFKHALGLDIVHVPYKGASLFVSDLVSGRIDMALASLTVAGQQLKSGKIVPLAVTSKQRSPLYPELPSVAESLIPGYEVTAWFAVMAPAGVPREIVTRLNGEIERFIAKPDVKTRLLGLGLDANFSSPEGLAEIIRSEIAKWGKVVRDAKIKVD